MKLFKLMASKIKNLYQTLSRFLLTAVFLLAAEIINIINTDSLTNEYSKYILVLILGAFLSCISEVVYERFLPKMKFRVFGGIISVVLTVAYFFAFLYSGELNTEKMIRTLIIIFALFIGFIWFPIIKTKVSFNESFMVVFKSFFISVFFSLIIFGGVSLILAAINNLLFTIDNDSYAYASGIIFIIFAPLYFLSLIPDYSKKEYTEYEKEHMEKMTSYGKFLEILISYILVPLASVFTLILLIYIVINLRDEFWQNSLLEPMLVSYSIVVILLYVLSSNIKNKFALWFRKIFPKVLIPIVLFQTIASILKINDAGLPFTRYYVIMYGAFALFSGILFSFTNIKKNYLIAPVLIGLMIISIIPPIDSFSVGKRNQINMLEETLESNNMLNDDIITPDGTISDSDKERITKNVEYITMMGYEDSLPYLGEDFDMYLDFGEKFGFEPFYNYDTGIMPDYFNASTKTDDNSFNIEGYDKLIITSLSSYPGNTDEHIVVGSFVSQNKTYSLYFNGEVGKAELTLKDDSHNEILSFNLYEEMHALKDELTKENSNVEYLLTPEESEFVIENEIAEFKFILRNVFIESYEESESINIDGFVLINIK